VQVQRVKLFKTHPEGVAMVKFKAPDAAQKCIQLMHGRWFGGRQLVAHLWDGLANYNVKVQETAEEQEARLEAFARELEEKGRQQEAQQGQQQGQEQEQEQEQEQQEQQPVEMEA
jgi:HIV Tat-specific factor 1